MKPLSLSLAGRGEDNAAHGGQVAHISAAEAELLKSMGGAGSINPITGLPEYMFGGFTYGGPPGSSLSPGSGGAVATSGRGRAASLAPPGLLSPPYGLTSSRGGPSSSTSVAPPPPPPAPPPAQLGGPKGNVSAITTPAEAAANAIAVNSTMYGVEGPGGILGFTPSPSPGAGTGATPPSNVPSNIANAVSVNPTMYGLQGPGGIGPSGTGSTAPTTVTDALIEHYRPPKEGDSLGKVLSFLFSVLPGPLALPSMLAAFFADAAGGNMGGPPPPGTVPPSMAGGQTFTYGGYSPPPKSGISQLLQNVPATVQDPVGIEPVVSAAPVNTAPVTALLQVDPEEEGFSPAVQRIRQLFFESLA